MKQAPGGNGDTGGSFTYRLVIPTTTSTRAAPAPAPRRPRAPAPMWRGGHLTVSLACQPALELLVPGCLPLFVSEEHGILALQFDDPCILLANDLILCDVTRLQILQDRQRQRVRR